MKKIFIFAFSIIILFGLTACSDRWKTYRYPRTKNYQFANTAKTYGYEKEVAVINFSKRIANDGKVSYVLNSAYVFIEDIAGDSFPDIEEIIFVNDRKESNGSYGYSKIIYKTETSDKIVAYQINVYNNYEEIFLNSDFEIIIEYRHKIPDAETKTFSYIFPMYKCKV